MPNSISSTTATNPELLMSQLVSDCCHWMKPGRRDLAKLPWPTKNLPEIIGNITETLRALIREYLFVSLFRACAESLASENASRLAAMQRADKNIDELLENLNGAFYRLRQSGIDEELFEVVSGFEALSKARSPRQMKSKMNSQNCCSMAGQNDEFEKLFF